MNIFGFSLLRNGIKYDYPYRESLQSLCDLCSSVYLALGKSEDGTESSLSNFKNIKIIPTIWDENMRKSGLILSEQTNIALEKLREEQNKNGWGIYLQADEVLNPENFTQIKNDIQKASDEGYDAVSFRYLHFWQNYHSIAISKRWYPQEIRAIRLNSNAASYGDAQSFSNCAKIFYSDVPVFHYGHVREANAYALKKKDFNRWWHKDDELEKVVERGKKREKGEKIIPYLGPHPLYMKNKIGANSLERKNIIALGDSKKYSPEFLKSIQANILWTNHWKNIISAKPSNTVILEQVPFIFHVLTLGKFVSKVPEKMFSPQARPWRKEFLALLKFSEKRVGVLSRDTHFC